jgi:hypothetical protein
MMPIRAEIIRSDRCEAEGHTVRASAPVLAMCRKLVDAGYDPARPLEAYRGHTLCLSISAIGWGAKHTVEDNPSGTPSLRRWRGPPGMVAASPVRDDAAPAITPSEQPNDVANPNPHPRMWRLSRLPPAQLPWLAMLHCR